MDAENQSLAEKVVNRMFEHDAFSQWLGIRKLNISEGSATLCMTVRADMLNGFKILHGGVSYALADSALAFSCNSHGIKSVSIETSISHILPCKEGDILTTQVEEQHKGNKTAIYQIKILNQESSVVALFKGTVYRTGKLWFTENKE